MAVFIVTAPDGRKFRITKPDDEDQPAKKFSVTEALRTVAGQGAKVVRGVARAATQPVDPTDPAGLKERLVRTERPEATFGGAGFALGGLVPVPGARAAGAAAGTALGRSVQLSKEATQRRQAQAGGAGQALEAVGIRPSRGLPPGAGTDIAFSGAGAGILSSIGLGGVRVGQLTRRGGPKVAPQIAARVRASFVTAGKQAGQKFDAAITQIDPARRVSLRSTIESLKEQVRTSPKLGSDLRAGMKRSKNKLLQKLLDNPELADDLTIRQAQDIKNTITRIPSLTTKSGKFGVQFSDTDLDLLEAVTDIRGEMLEAAPEMSEINKQFGQVRETFKLLKNRFKEGSLLGNIEKNFKDPEILKRVKEFLPAEALQDIKLLGQSMRFRTEAGRVPGRLAGAATTAAILRLLFRGKFGGGGLNE